MPIEKVDSTDLTYYLVCYDKDGKEQTDRWRPAERARLRARFKTMPITDVFIMSHGWRGDIPAAKEQYNRWIQAMAGCEADRKQIRELRKDFKPLLVGFHWPSQPWGDEEIGVGAGASFAAPGGRAGGSLEDAIANTSSSTPIASPTTPAARAALTTIFSAAARGTPPGNKLPPDVAEAYRTLDRESGMGDGGPGAAPGDDREPFNPNRAYANAKPVPGQPPSFGGGGLSSLLSPLRQTVVLEDEGSRAHGRRVRRILAALERAESGAPGPRRSLPPDGAQLRLHRHVRVPERARRQGHVAGARCIR